MQRGPCICTAVASGHAQSISRPTSEKTSPSRHGIGVHGKVAAWWVVQASTQWPCSGQWFEWWPPCACWPTCHAVATAMQWFQWWSCACCPSHSPRRAPRPRTQARAVIRHEICPRMQRTLPPSLLRRHHRSKPPTTATPEAAQRFTSVPLIRSQVKKNKSHVSKQKSISSTQTPHQQSLHSRCL
jgi:hypothetical protein